jgi:dipeptidyl aminopeptidase/acylaminoacyl peptidase
VLTTVVDGRRDYVAFDLDTGERTTLAEDTEVALPTISPDREWVTYLPGPPGTLREAWLARVDGTEADTLLGPALRAECRRTHRPAWSPDGEELAVACMDAEEAVTGLWIVTRDGEPVREIVGTAMLGGGPTWGANGVVYYEGQSDQEAPRTLWAVPADGSAEPVQLTDGSRGWDSHPDWSEGGLLFLRSPGRVTYGDIWVARGEDDVVPLTDQGNVRWPTWSPDGSQMTWVEAADDDGDGRPDSSTTTLWVGRVAESGGELQLVDRTRLDVPGNLAPPTWGSR